MFGKGPTVLEKEILRQKKKNKDQAKV